MAYFGDQAINEKEYFVHQFDRLFDCLNVRNQSEWMHKKKPDLKPYTIPEVRDLRSGSYLKLLLSLKSEASLRI